MFGYFRLCIFLVILVNESVPSLALDPPTNIQAEAVNSTALRVTWIPSVDPPLEDVSYTAYVIDNHFGNATQSSVAGYNSTEVVVAGLRPYWNYTTYVQAATTSQKINGTNSAPATTKQAAPGTVQSVSASSLVSENTCSLLSVSWIEPDLYNRNGIITGYIVTASAQDQPTVSQSFSQELRTGQIGPVNPNNVEYTINVAATTVAGKGSPSVDQPKVKTGVCAPENFTSADVMFVISSPGTADMYVPSSPHQQFMVKLDNSFFGSDVNGNVTYSGIIVVDSEKLNLTDDQVSSYKDIYAINNKYTTWAIAANDPPYRSYRATSNSFSVPIDVKSVADDAVTYYTVGGDGETCSPDRHDVYCDGYLQPDRIYRVKAFKCTAGGCRSTHFLPTQYRTAGAPQLWIIAAVLVPLAVGAGLVVLATFLWRRKSKRNEEENRNGIRLDAPRVCRNARPQSDIGGEDIYTMESGEPVQRAIKTSDFVEHISLCHADDNCRFKEEYKAIQSNVSTKKKDAALLESNHDKNRFKNALPYDFNRVKLAAIYDNAEGTNDYINASKVPGHNANPEYIASQGPLADTKADFWRMIWEQDVNIIVMLTKCEEKGKEKCAKYWPRVEKTTRLADMHIKLNTEITYRSFIQREIELSKDGQTRTIKQYQYTAWPETGVPDDPDCFMEFMKTVQNGLPPDMTGPLCVHCSTGTSRTGVYITVHRLLHTIPHAPTIDVYTEVLALREHRDKMIASDTQYIFVYDCVRMALEKEIYFTATGGPVDSDYYAVLA